MNQKQKISYLILGVALVITGIIFSERTLVQSRVSNALVTVKDYLEYNNIIATSIREQLFPQTLISSSNNQKNVLNRGAVIELTNKERQQQGLAILTESTKLDKGAEQKLDDLFARQYFDHVSPDGNGPSWIADQAGYAYVIVGENLALGDFKDNEALVAAWMASPGHRANILNTRFVDIGVAVKRGMYEGKMVWIAVQEFGKPLSDCPAIESTLRTKIEQDRNAVDAMGTDLANRRQELSSMSQSSPAEQDAYNKKVVEYNNKVAEYNNLAASLKAEIQDYNTEVQAFNVCIKE